MMARSLLLILIALVAPALGAGEPYLPLNETIVLNENFAILPSSCAEAFYWAGKGAKSGIYQIQVPDSELKPFYVYCMADPDGGAAWTLFQRRLNGDINFLRGWNEYKLGFGNINNNFFIGLDRIYAMTHAEHNELWVELGDFEDETRYAKYDSFAIGDEREKYILYVLGAYSGNAGDSLSHHGGERFSTIDQDNSFAQTDCAGRRYGAWWYKNCHRSHLNGLYLNGENDKFAQGVIWYTWHGDYYSLKYTHMAIRPRK